MGSCASKDAAIQPTTTTPEQDLATVGSRKKQSQSNALKVLSSTKQYQQHQSSAVDISSCFSQRRRSQRSLSSIKRSSKSLQPTNQDSNKTGTTSTTTTPTTSASVSSIVTVDPAKSLSTSFRALPKDFGKFERQCDLYLDTSLTTLVPATSHEIPNLAPDVVRWEWNHRSATTAQGHLTGKGRDTLIALDIFSMAAAARDGSEESSLPVRILSRKHRFSQDQPFVRSRIQFQRTGHSEMEELYIEFTFNENAQIIFIEVWWPDGISEKNKENNARPQDWSQGWKDRRISTHIPGLGSPSSTIHLKELKRIAKENHELQALSTELDKPLKKWFEAELLRRLQEQQEHFVSNPAEDDTGSHTSNTASETHHSEGDDDGVTTLQRFKQMTRLIERSGRRHGVNIFFPPPDDGQWELDGEPLDAAVNIASSSVNVLVFAPQT